MKDLQQSLFDVYALSLPHGHGFGSAPLIGAWQSDDSLACGAITHDDKRAVFGILVLRRRVDHVWVVTSQHGDIKSFDNASMQLKLLLKEGTPPEPMPPNTAPRPALHDLKGRQPSEIFQLLTKPSHHAAAWMLNQLYISLPSPDANWVTDCQTENFHTRLWESQLLACFREQGLLVTQPKPSPDFLIQNRLGGSVWIEAVTTNPQERYNHVNSVPSEPPQDRKERLLGSASLRFAKTLGNKIEKKYHDLPHVADQPFIIAITDFHAPASMTWSREALISYLYGTYPFVEEVDGRRVASEKPITHLLGDSKFPAGLFCNKKNNELSAIIFTNACSIAKFNRVPVSAGILTKGLRYVRVGEFYDRRPNALKGIPFCLDVTSPEYRSLWPQGYEPWSAELEVFHNPFAKHPVSKEILPESSHWFMQDGEMMCSSFYETSILYSKTIIQNKSDKMLTLDDFT
jgi:hypothetical protein